MFFKAKRPKIDPVDLAGLARLKAKLCTRHSGLSTGVVTAHCDQCRLVKELNTAQQDLVNLKVEMGRRYKRSKGKQNDS